MSLPKKPEKIKTVFNTIFDEKNYPNYPTEETDDEGIKWQVGPYFYCENIITLINLRKQIAEKAGDYIKFDNICFDRHKENDGVVGVVSRIKINPNTPDKLLENLSTNESFKSFKDHMKLGELFTYLKEKKFIIVFNEESDNSLEITSPSLKNLAYDSLTKIKKPLAPENSQSVKFVNISRGSNIYHQLTINPKAEDIKLQDNWKTLWDEALSDKTNVSKTEKTQTLPSTFTSVFSALSQQSITTINPESVIKPLLQEQIESMNTVSYPPPEINPRSITHFTTLKRTHSTELVTTIRQKTPSLTEFIVSNRDKFKDQPPPSSSLTSKNVGTLDRIIESFSQTNNEEILKTIDTLLVSGDNIKNLLLEIEQKTNEEIDKIIAQIVNTTQKIVNDELIKVLETTQNNNPRIFVISDVHGNYAAYQDAIKKIINRCDGKLPYMLISLGDLVDRGSKSKHVVLANSILTLKYYKNIISLKGNHETKEFSENTECIPRNFWDSSNTGMYINLFGKISGDGQIIVFPKCEDGYYHVYLFVHGAIKADDLSYCDGQFCINPDNGDKEALTWNEYNLTKENDAFNSTRGKGWIYGKNTVITLADYIKERIAKTCKIDPNKTEVHIVHGHTHENTDEKIKDKDNKYISVHSVNTSHDSNSGCNILEVNQKGVTRIEIKPEPKKDDIKSTEPIVISNNPPPPSLK